MAFCDARWFKKGASALPKICDADLFSSTIEKTVPLQSLVGVAAPWVSALQAVLVVPVMLQLAQLTARARPASERRDRCFMRGIVCDRRKRATASERSACVPDAR